VTAGQGLVLLGMIVLTYGVGGAVALIAKWYPGVWLIVFGLAFRLAGHKLQSGEGWWS
jgi:hypothetical protein